MSHARALTDALDNLRQKEDALSEAMGEVERRAAQMARQPQHDATANDWPRERALIADRLETFYRSPLSMSSVAPILELAEAMNPTLRRPTLSVNADSFPESWRPFAKETK